jgi:TrmH family RNA methyltransferase
VKSQKLEWNSMLSQLECGRVCVILVRARNPSNIGAVARAMYDFGFSRLRVVNEFPVPFEAARSAVDASEVLAGATLYASLAEAVADCTLIVGTTAVGERDLQHELLPLAQAAPRIRAELQRSDESRVALLFGSEKTGLSNDELSHCNWLLTIPMQIHEDARHPSMNLGQAVAVCLYDLVREQQNGSHAVTNETPGVVAAPTAANLERITELLLQIMEKTGYDHRYPHNCNPAQVRRLVRRIGVDAVDAPVWMGILRQILWKLDEKPPS